MHIYQLQDIFKTLKSLQMIAVILLDQSILLFDELLY